MPKHSKISQTPADRSKPHHKGVLFIQGVPQTTKQHFKSACSLNGESMRDAIIKLMRRYVANTKGKRIIR